MDYQKLTQLTTELEGLLLALANQDNEHRRNLIKVKFDELTVLMNDLTASFETPQSSMDNEDTRQSTTTPVEETEDSEVKLQEAEDAEVEDETQIASEIISHEESETEAEAEAELEPEDDEIVAITFDEELPSDMEPISDQDEVILSDSDESMEPLTIEEDDAQSTLQANQPTERVDEMLARREAMNLKKIFTLNDKFRFRRALFNQDDNFFGQVLEELATLPTYADACGHVVDKYSWRLDNPDVEDFLSIIKPHYKE